MARAGSIRLFLFAVACVCLAEGIAIGFLDKKSPQSSTQSNPFLNYAPLPLPLPLPLPPQQLPLPSGGEVDQLLRHHAITEEEVRGRASEFPELVNCACSKIYEPICGSDDRSYYNRCLFDCQTGKNGTINVKHAGNCIPF